MGIPSGTAYVQPGNSFIVQEMMNSGAISPGSPSVSFSWDQSSKAGNCIIGGYDFERLRSLLAAFSCHGPNTPSSRASVTSGRRRCRAMRSATRCWRRRRRPRPIGSRSIRDRPSFKGDDDLMNERWRSPRPERERAAGDHRAGPAGRRGDRHADGYAAHVQCRDPNRTRQGRADLRELQPLGLPGLALVGSTLIESCCPIFEYAAVGQPRPVYARASGHVWIFNKKNGPKVVSAGATEQWDGTPRPVLNAVGEQPAPPGPRPSFGPAVHCRRKPEPNRSGGGRRPRSTRRQAAGHTPRNSVHRLHISGRLQ